MGYVYSLDDETFGSDEFTTRDAAAAAAVDDHVLQAGEVFYTALVVPLTVADLVGELRADRVCDGFGECAYEVVGDVADDWLRDVTADAARDLEQRLHDAVVEWFAAWPQYRPSFSRVEDVVRHVVHHG